MPENHTSYQERLASLRMQIQENTIDGYIIPRTDEFQGEFLAAYAERLQWLTGFTGSAGFSVVLEDKAVVMSDGRYTLQLAQQVSKDLYDLGDSTKVSVGEWLSQNAKEGSRIGYDTWLHTPQKIESITEKCKEKHIELIPISGNLIDHIWNDQPPRPQEKAINFPYNIAGKTSEEKCGDIADEISNKGCAACLITMSDSICWALNVRGGDIAYSPLVLSYALIHVDGTVDWFVDQKKVRGSTLAQIGGHVRLRKLKDMERRISSLSGKLWMDKATVPEWFVGSCDKHGIDIHYETDPCVMPKAIKTAQEQESIREAHIQDAVALVKFFRWLDENANKIEMDELSVEEKLEGFRRERKGYLEPSFPAIVGFQGNGAVIHYRATEETNKEIKGDGLLLIDSGGQYQWGTTDITRTICIGTPTQEMKENYTRVLKGHIAVASAEFLKGTTGKEIDELARESLREVGLDYAHGTGHGVGCYLCVHEAAANISPRSDKPLQAGMLLSNEPGYYKENEYGIRIENLIFVQERQEQLHFETVSFVPFDEKLIVQEMLTEQEYNWLNKYHEMTISLLSPHLSAQDLKWLHDKGI